MNKTIKKYGKNCMAAISKSSPVVGAYLLYILRTHRIPNLKNPKNFNEKMTYLKLNDYATNDMVVKCADKYLVRNYVKEKGYEQILNTLYGVYDNADQINFNKLPEKFALKCTHGCKYNIICNDKLTFNASESRKKLNSWLSEKYGYATQEIHYTKIKPKIIAENNLCDENNMLPIDYKLYCFDGEVKAIKVSTDREYKLKRNFFDKVWSELEFGKKRYRNSIIPSKPRLLNDMIKIAEDLSLGFPFVRVDLYEVKDKIIFGELTFTPACCCSSELSRYGNDTLGSYLNIAINSRAK